MIIMQAAFYTSRANNGESGPSTGTSVPPVKSYDKIIDTYTLNAISLVLSGRYFNAEQEEKKKLNLSKRITQGMCRISGNH